MVNSNATPIGKMIKKRLIDKDMTSRELAEEVGTSKQYISHIINGYRTGDKYMEKIREVLEIEE